MAMNRILQYVVIFCTIFLVGSCSTTVNMYPIEGPLSLQSPLPILIASVDGITPMYTLDCPATGSLELDLTCLASSLSHLVLFSLDEINNTLNYVYDDHNDHKFHQLS